MPIIGTLPYNIVNGEVIDAVPVMADLNYIVTQVNLNAQPTGASSFPGGPSSSRPTSPQLYESYFDTTLGFEIWCSYLSPVTWVNAAGVTMP